MMDLPYAADPEPYNKLIELVRGGKPAVLATVVETDGSTPQVAGASALFSGKGLVCGTVGGGVGEARVEILARRAVTAGASRLATFNLGFDPAAESEAICGGRLRVLIDARPVRHIPAFMKMLDDLRRRRPGALVTWIGSRRGAAGADIRRVWLPAGGRILPVKPPFSMFMDVLRAAVRAPSPGLFEGNGGALYVEPHIPVPRLLIAGAGHVGRAVAHLGRLLNFEVVVADDRPEFANADRFPGVKRVIVAGVARTLREFPVGPDTYIVIVTRGHRHDEDALRACVRSKADYIGMIGSARKVGLLRERFLENGWCSPAEWDRVRTPIGLPIGSKTVEEIAVSIAAELVAVRSGKRKAEGDA